MKTARLSVRHDDVIRCRITRFLKLTNDTHHFRVVIDERSRRAWLLADSACEVVQHFAFFLQRQEHGFISSIVTDRHAEIGITTTRCSSVQKKCMSLHAFQPHFPSSKRAIIILHPCYGTLMQCFIVTSIPIMR